MNERQQQQQQDFKTVQFTTFLLGEELFGIESIQVQEILPYQDMTPVPLAPEYVKGLLNLRGQILTVLDLRRRLGFETFRDEETGMNLIVNIGGDGAISLFVDRIGNIVDIPTERLLLPPGIIHGVAADYIRNVCQLEKELLIVLNTNNILQAA